MLTRCLVLGLALIGLNLGAQDLTVRGIYHETSDPRWSQAVVLGPGARHLDQVPLGSLGPNPGYFTFSYLGKKWDFPSDMTITGTGTIYLPSRGYTPEEEEFLTQFITFLRDQRENDQVSFTLENLDLPRDLPPQVEFKLTGGSKKDGIPLGKTTAAWRAVGGPWKVGQTLTFQYRPYLILPQARRDLSLGEVLGEDNLTREITDLGKVYGKPVDLNEGIWAASRVVRKGEVLREGSIKQIFEVNKGESVTLQITKGTLSVEMSALALEDGRQGQTLRVRTSTGKNFNAVVMDRSMVRVELP